MKQNILLALLCAGIGIIIIASAAFAVRPRHKILWFIFASIGFSLLALGYLQFLYSVNGPV